MVVLLVQFSEIPFGNLFSLMFLSSKSPPSEMVDNITLSSDLIPNNGTVQESDLSSNRSASGDLLMKESIIGPSKGGYAPNEAMMRHIGTSIGNLPSPAPAPSSLPPRGTDNGSSINDLMSSPTPALAPVMPLMIGDKSVGNYSVSIVPNASPMDKELAPSPGNDKNSATHSVDKKPLLRASDVLTIEDMNELMRRIQSTYFPMVCG